LHSPRAVTRPQMKPVTISYQDLLPFSDASALHTSLLDAFGSGEGALGLLIVSDLPAEFAALREACLLKACEFARLVRRPLYAHCCLMPLS
jgi:hypothetical protein